jgi:hypothetical protein
VIIGVDFDNTIVSYDELIYREAIEGVGGRRGFEEQEDHSRCDRELPDGEIQWQKIQAPSTAEDGQGDGDRGCI